MKGVNGMSKSKYTPGPRTVDRDDAEDGNIYYAVHGQDYEFVANFDKKADAILDAAAPDLLEACYYLIRQLEHAMDGARHENGKVFVPGKTDLELLPDGSYPLSQARTAIAKATGNAP